MNLSPVPQPSMPPHPETGLRRVLITGYSPFPGCPVNPSQEIIEALQQNRLHSPGWELIPALLPVEYARLKSELDRRVEEHQPDLILSFGVGRQPEPFRLESRGINQNHGELPDNSGEIRVQWPIDSTGPAEFITPLDLDRLRDYLVVQGHATVVSRDAGLYLCNHLVYLGLQHSLNHPRRMPFLFIHLARPEHGISLEQNLSALECLLGWFLAEPPAAMRLAEAWPA